MRISPLGRQASSRGHTFRRFLIAFFALAATAALLYLARAPLLRAFGTWWVVDEPPAKSEALVVLGGDSIDAARVRRAVGLYQQGWAPRIVLAGGMIRWYLSEASLMKKDAEGFGAPASALEVVESPADSTLEEAVEMLHYVTGHNFHRILVVTSDAHSRRARAVYSAALKKRGLEVRIISAPQFFMGSERWWENREALKQLFFEFIKYSETWWELRHLSDSTLGPVRGSSPPAQGQVP